jgi:hypothetical protein
MTGFLDTLQEKVKALGSSWTSYTVVGSFVLYVFGYLAIRFHLTALGVGTDLAVLDERYVFTGARFLVYLVASVTSVVLMALILAALGYLFYRLLPAGVRSRLLSCWQQCLARPERLMMIGIIVSVLMIQLVMRKCFFFSNLLIARELPADHAWLARLLFNERRMSLYFGGLVAGTGLPLAILLTVQRAPAAAGRLLFLKGLLAFLVAVQFLFLPVNYGVFIVDKTLPRVSSLGVTPLAPGQEAWLAWEGKEGVTYLVRNRLAMIPDGTGRSLVTLPRSEVKKTEITRYDKIFPLLFDP